MKIFLSWSGEKSKGIAQSLREWLPLILYYSDPWISEKDITSGDRWSIGMGKELEEAKFGIICLCDDNLLAPWILFEAGALSKSMATASVCPLLFHVDTKDLPSPLSQFQAKKFDREQIYELVNDINKKVDTPITQDRIDQLFEVLWPQLESKILSLPLGSARNINKKSQDEILETMADNVQRLEFRMQEMMVRLFDYVEKNIQVQESQMHRFVEMTARNKYMHVPVRDLPNEVDREFIVHQRTTPQRILTQVRVSPLGGFKESKGRFSFVSEPKFVINRIAKHYGVEADEFGKTWYLFPEDGHEAYSEAALLELVSLSRRVDVRISDLLF